MGAFLQLLAAAVLARLLGPEAFGLVAIGDLTLRFVNYFSRAGVGQAMIQKPELDPVDVRAGFTASAAIGAGFTGLLWLAAPLGGLLFDAPDVVPVLRWMSLSLVMYGVGAPAEALLRRELRFRTIALRDIASYVVGYPVVGLLMAAAGYGVWSLVAATLTQTGLRSLLAYLAYRHSLVPTLDRAAHRSLLGFGGQVSVISFLEFLGYELDTYAVGRYGGTAALGFYNRAYLLVRLPVYHLTTAFSKVIFPAMSSVQEQLERFRGAYVSAVRTVAVIVLPTAAGMAIAGAELVSVVLGPGWEAAIPVLPWIALASALTMVTHVGEVALEARGLLRGKLVVATGRVVVLAGALVLAAGGPLWGYGAALAAAQVFAHVAYIWLVARMLDLRPREVVAGYLPAVGATVVVAGAIASVRWGAAVAGASGPVSLLAQVLTGSVALVASLRLPALTPFRADLHQRLRNAGAGGARPDDAAAVARLTRLVLGPTPPADRAPTRPDERIEP